MRRLGWMAVAVCAATSGAAPAFATVGGPTLCEVLGWDAKAKRVYVHQEPMHGGDAFGDVLFFDFGTSDTVLAGSEPWAAAGAGEGKSYDPELQRRLAALRATLRPLEHGPAKRTLLPLALERVGTDTLAWYGDRLVRERVRADFGGVTVEVPTFGGMGVALAGVWRIPDRTERLFVIAFRGDPFEGGYEVQVPLVVKERETEVRRVGWGGSGR